MASAHAFTSDTLELERVETTNLMMTIADRLIMMMEAMVAGDMVSAMVRGIDAYVPLQSHVSELWARRLVTRGNTELLHLLHVDIPLGLRQLVTQLGRNRTQESQFFLAGGSGSALAPLVPSPAAQSATPVAPTVGLVPIAQTDLFPSMAAQSAQSNLGY
jgi:hypothetical protein